MAHLEYYNAIVDINERLYESHKNLLEKVLLELGQYDKLEEFATKFLDQPKLKAKKDPNEPSKPKSAFILFCNEKREPIMAKCKAKNKKEKKKFNLGEVQKELGKLWGDLSEEERKKFDQLSEQDRIRYENEIEKYKENLFGSIYSN